MYIQTDELVRDYQTRVDFVQQHIIQHVQQHGDASLSRQELAAVAGFSVSHFHRIFKAFVGESLAAYVRRIRLEKAVKQIIDEDFSITDVALASGYDTPAAFTKAFKKHFGVNPSALRCSELNSAKQFIQRANDPSYLGYLMSRNKVMKPKFRTRSERQIAYIRDEDTFEGIYRAWDKLGAFMNDAKTVISDEWECLGIVHDAYAIEDVSREEWRYDACVGIDDTEHASKRVATFQDIAIQRLDGGRYAVFLHEGDLEKLPETWKEIYKEWLPRSGEQLRDAPPFEVYLDSPETPAKERRTEIYIPVT